MKLWEWLSRFLHKADLMPLVVVVSVFHYYQALKSHDPLFVALPIALFIDLLHYRSVQRAVKSGQVGWMVAAVVTTAAAFGLQWMFYAEGNDLPVWKVMIFASIVPVGLAIWAWLQLSMDADQVTDWQAQIAAAQKAAEEAQAQAAAAKAEALAAQKLAQEAQMKADRAQTEAADWQKRAVTAQAEAEKWQRVANKAQTQVSEWQPMIAGWLSLNRRYQLVAMINAGQLPKEQVMSELSLSRRTVEQDMARLNGVGHE